MPDAFFTLLMIFVFGTLGVLMLGVIVMARGKDTNARLSNKLMIARVCIQALAVLLLGVTFFIR